MAAMWKFGAFGIVAVVVGIVLEEWADRRAGSDRDVFHGELVVLVTLVAWTSLLIGLCIQRP